MITAVQHIRPYRIFAAVDAEGAGRVAHVRLSKRRGLAMASKWRGLAMASNDATVREGIADCSLTYLETMVVVAALKLTNARRALEFGTHLGSTTLNLALNLPDDGTVCTFDLVDVRRFKEWWAFDRETQAKITAIGGQDSSSFDFSRRWRLFNEGFDFVWIDGNPDRSDDTRNAFHLLNDSKLSCIGWHDYRADGANTTETVERLAAEGRTIYHIEDTKVALYFNRPVAL